MVSIGGQGGGSFLAMPVVDGYSTLTGLTANALNADWVVATLTPNYQSATVQVLGTWVGTLTFQGSEDGTNWVSLPATNVSTGASATTATANGVYQALVGGINYFRVRMTAYSSGPVTGVVTFSPFAGGGASSSGGGTSSVNLAQVAGATVATGHGTAAGALRVELPTDGTGIVGLAAGSALIGQVATIAPVPAIVTGSTTTRPNDTAPYAFGDLLANNTAAGSVTYPTITVAKAVDQPFTMYMMRLTKSGTGISNSIFRVHLFNTQPTVSNGDNGAFLTNNVAGWVGAFDVTIDLAFTNGASGRGGPSKGAVIEALPVSGAQTLYYLIEVRGAYTPIANEIFTPIIEVA